VRLEASTKPHVHRKFEIFWTNIASTMACPNFKNGPKTGLRPLGVNKNSALFQMWHYFANIIQYYNLMFRIEWLWNHNFWTKYELVMDFQRVLSPNSHEHH
jgi:hypothetical protein